MKHLAIVLALAAWTTIALPAAGRADDSGELDRIPTPGPSASASPAPHALSGKVFLEDAGSLEDVRTALPIAYPSPLPAAWENRTSLDAIEVWTGRRTSVTLSDRLNVTEESAFAFPSSQTVRNDLRELFASVRLGVSGYVEAGRINVRNGVALGFNPTDFFKTRTLVDQASLDPTVLRTDRLGTVIAGVSILSGRGSADLFFAPDLAAPSSISYVPLSGFNPRLDKTNSSNRVELSFSDKIADLEPQALVYADDTQLRFGFNVSHQMSKEVVLYGEWAGGAQGDLIARALAYGKLTGTFPAQAQSPLPNDAAVHFRNDLSAGGSWTGPQNITVNAEYEYHQSGLSRSDWLNWLDARTSAALKWYIRGYANDQQEPFVRQQVFLRADRTNAFVRDLELTGFAFVDLQDGSILTQIAASYDLSSQWTLALYLSANAGGSNTERGTLPQARGVTFQARRYL